MTDFSEAAEQLRRIRSQPREREYEVSVFEGTNLKEPIAVLTNVVGDSYWSGFRSFTLASGYHMEFPTGGYVFRFKRPPPQPVPKPAYGITREEFDEAVKLSEAEKKCWLARLKEVFK